MSVSSRSPTKIGCVAPSRCTVSSSSGRYGLPATSGSAFTAIRTAATAAPLPGTMPRSVGRVGSVLVATQCAPRWMAMAASLRWSQVRSAPQPWITATGRSSAERDPDQPQLLERVPDPGAADGEHRGAGPETSSRAGGRRPAPRSRRRPRRASIPSSTRCSATTCGGRLALLVTKPTRTCAATQLRNALGCSGHRHRPEIDHAVEIEQRGVVGLDERGRRHRRVLGSRNGRASSESSSKADSSKIDDHAVEFVAPDSQHRSHRRRPARRPRRTTAAPRRRSRSGAARRRTRTPAAPPRSGVALGADRRPATACSRIRSASAD